jgi:general secretion pathway protein A
VAGLSQNLLFSKKNLNRVFRMTGGIPRLINMICDRALLGAYVQDKNRVDHKTLVTAAREVFGKSGPLLIKVRLHPVRTVLFVFIFLAVLSVPVIYWNPRSLLSSLPLARPQKAVEVKVFDDSPLLGLEKPAEITTAATRDSAFQALFNCWGIRINPSERKSPCEQALEHGLLCLNDKGGFTDLRQLNKPVMLSLINQQGERYFAALLSLDEKSALFTIGKENRKVDIGELGSNWLGEYTLFWKAPPIYTKKPGWGSRGPFVSWIDQQLSIVQGRPAKPAEKQSYDDAMKKEIRAFQVSAGLVPDGIIGPKTLICLANATGVGGPTLMEKTRNR